MSFQFYLVAIVALALLIVVHEGGHFLVARLCGMRVERFSIGFGKPLVSFKKGDTVYQIAPIPLGGFVQITGLNPHEEFDANDPYVYPNRPRWMRLLVLIAGPGANYLTAVLLLIGIFLMWGDASVTSQVEKIVPGSPAEAVGLKTGDVILSANGNVVESATPASASPVTAVVRGSNGKPVTVVAERGGQPLTFSITPRKDPASGYYFIGVGFGQKLTPLPFGEAVTRGVVRPVQMSADMLSSMWKMIIGAQPRSLSGPVGIVGEMAEAAKRGTKDLVWIVMVLSIYLGLFNMLPLPALDGGRVLFLGINALPIKQVDARTEAAVHMVGLLLLLGVFVLVTFKDIKDVVVKIVN